MTGGPAPLASSLAEGALFADDYRIVRPLARGGMGAVYLVEQTSTGKSRALKLMLPELAADADMRRRFQQEARIGAKIESAHVVEIHSAGVDEATRTPYLVMELLDGEDVEARVARSGPLSPAQAALVFEQLCHAVSAAHDVGIIHRDLKPNNVFLAKTKRAGDAHGVEVKVLDFGIAKLVAEAATRGQTMGMMGTPFWMAPEQTERGPVTPAADVWALGLILYFVLTGRQYWLTAAEPDATLTQIMKEVLLGPLPPAAERAREQGVAERMPAAVASVLARCIVRDPTQRFANGRELWAALAPALPRSGDAAWSAPALPAAPPAARSGPTALAQTTPAYAPPPPNAITPGPSPGAAPPFAPGPPLGVSLGEKARFGPMAFKWGGAFVVALVAILVRTCSHREPKPPAAEPHELVTAPIQVPQRVTPGPANAAPPCRLCTTNVEVVEGPLVAAEVRHAVEARFPNFDSECMITSKRKSTVRAGMVTVRFNVVAGRATNRSVEASSPSPNGGIDTCFERAFSDVALPNVTEPSVVLYTMSFNPSAH
jgi:tRNA A-37 threonylcarbamoyl transferase component Bud32